MTITPDTKDWTWVISRKCPECGFDATAFPRESVGAMVRSIALRWRDVLAAGEASRRRPRSDVWSPLEYAAHVRDGLRINTYRLGLMLADDDPLFANWDQDATAISENYAEQDPAVVGAEIVEAAGELAAGFDGVPADAWTRTGHRSDGANFTVETFARYYVHDPIHHLYDCGVSMS